VVADADRIASHGLQEIQATHPNTNGHRHADRTAVRMKADAIQLRGDAVQDEASVDVPGDGPDSERGFDLVHDFVRIAGPPESRAKRVLLRPFDRPEMGLADAKRLNDFAAGPWLQGVQAVRGLEAESSGIKKR